MSLLEATRTSGPVGRFVGVTLHSIQPLQREREAPQVAPVVTCRRTEGLDDWCAGIRHISRAEDQNMGTEWRSDGTFRVGDWSLPWVNWRPWVNWTLPGSASAWHAQP